MSFRPNKPTGIDLRKEFSGFMEKYGWWALLRRPVGPRKTALFNEPTLESLDLQALADGRGYKDDWVRCRRMSLFDVPETPSPIGKEGVPLIRFYLEYHMKPDNHDFICEVALDEASMNRGAKIQPVQPVDVVKVWDIQEVTAMRGFGGRVEFWQLFVTEVVAGDLG